MKTRFDVKQNDGISLISVIITIIVIIILAAISMNVFNTQNRAEFAKFVQEFEEVRKGVETKRLINSKESVNNANDGFSKVYVSGNIPSNFESFVQSDGKQVAYLVNLSYIGYDELRTGKDYKNFEQVGDNIQTVVFGRDDVFVYDSTGHLFYAKGFSYDNKQYYEAMQ